MIMRNGKTAAGWRLDEMTDEGPVGMAMLLNPFAIVPDAKNAERIEKAFALLEEWRRTPFFEIREAWEGWVADFGARVDAVLSR